jgi:hypothetical protein
MIILDIVLKTNLKDQNHEENMIVLDIVLKTNFGESRFKKIFF